MSSFGSQMYRGTVQYSTAADVVTQSLQFAIIIYFTGYPILVHS